MRSIKISERVAKLGDDQIPVLVDELLSEGIRLGASDLHLEPGASRLICRYRVDGVFAVEEELPASMSEGVAIRLKVMARLAVERDDIPQEGRIDFRHDDHQGEYDLRISVMPVVRGEKIVARFFDLEGKLYRPEELGFDSSTAKGLEEILSARDGLFLVCGPSGSGKTTTIYSILRQLATQRGQRLNITSIEDPVERVIAGINQTQVDVARGLDYAAALKAVLRQDPEVVAVGEIRDPETAAAALRASLTGHLVISTLHCGRAGEAARRLVDLGLNPEVLASSLKGVLAQRLVRLRCGCRLGSECTSCSGSGYRGRVAFGEYLPCARAAVRTAITNNSDLEGIEAAGKKNGMRDMLTTARSLVRQKLTTSEETKAAL